MAPRKNHPRAASRSWEPVADWYTGWVGAEGSEHHRLLAIPALIDLLQPSAGEQVLDIGCGPGVLAPHVARTGARYTGVDASRKLIRFARKHHGAHGRFVEGDATRLAESAGVQAGAFHAAAFLLSIQDIDPLEDALASAAGALREGGRIVLLMTHPCFRIPRQSGWGWDAGRQLRFRRVDSYLGRLAVPMKAHGGGATRSYHRPLSAYVNGLAACGLYVDRIREIARASEVPGPHARAERRAAEEIPLFLALRAVKR